MPTNSQPISESNFPIEPVWILKGAIRSLISTTFSFGIFGGYLAFSAARISSQYLDIIFWGFFILFVVIQPPVWFLWSYLVRKNYKYSIDEKFLNLHQGVIHKENRQLPYASIQDITLDRSLWDRLFGLASIVVQNAAPGGGVVGAGSGSGFLGNMVIIPGLHFENAQQLRDLLLEKMKVNRSSVMGV